MKMEGRNRSGGHSSGVVKNRSSSGCLIIKKKVDGVSGVGSSKKEKKRARMNVAESFLSDDEYIELYPKRGVPGRSQVMGSSVSYENDDFEDMVFGRNGRMREVVPKGRELDVYDFDEYDELSDIEMMRMRHYHDHLQEFMPGLKNGSRLESESGSSKGDIIYKRRNSFHGGSSIVKNKGADLYSAKRRFEMRNDISVSMGKEKFGGSDDAIRLQGKNGVLKVRVKHREDTNEHLAPNYTHVKGNRVAPRSQALTSKNVIIRSSPSLENNVSKRPMPVDRLDKNQQRKRKQLSVESSEESEEEAEDNDSPLKPQSNSVQVHRSTKRGRSSGSTQSPQGAQPIKMKEGKVKRGSGTEKQLLREKIRTMLINAGWTIDYRPRRGRDYFDAVYVNPSGTAYWSIIKAYDALQKQLEEEGKSLKASEDSSSFAPISDDVLSKLTRQTRKKIEKELKRKKKEEVGGKRKKQSGTGYFDEHESDTYSGGSGKHDDKLSSFMKRRYGNNSNSKMQQRGENSSSMSNRFIHARNSKKIGRCMLLVRNSGKGSDSETDGFIPYTGKRNLLSWLIDCGTVKLSEKVHYMNRKCTRVMLEGWITREGIHCGCCSKILTVSKFELHAASKLRQPYQNIYLSSGASLMQCQIEAWNRQDESLRNGYNKIDVDGDDPNDDTCAMCGDGGNLICCDSCPSTFHQICLGIEMLPPGDWHCPYCSCKFCGLADMSPNEGIDRKQAPVLTCCLCEGKFHLSCVEEMDGTMNSSSPSFCGKTCQELSEHLDQLLGVKHELEGGMVWSLIHRVDIGSDSSVRGFPQRVEWNSKLAVALNVMDECFLPINDRRSGINMIHSVLYNSGSTFTRLNYGSFYTAILEKGDEIVAAASIRIHGTEFAEMPFIGTRHIYRRQGMCRQLFSGIESALRSLKVEKLIIPAISELMDTWTNVFGFSTLKESDKQKMKVRNMLVFPGTDMLQKKLYVKDSVEKDSAGVSSFENCPSDLNSVPNASNDCCKKVELCLATDCNDNKSTQSEDMKVNSVSGPLLDCHEEVILHCNDNKPPSQVVINEANLVVSNGECEGFTSSELQSVAKFDESVDTKDQISEDKNSDVLENSDTNKEVLIDENSIQEANIAVSECGSPPKDDKMVDTFSNGVLNCLSESKDESLPDPTHISVKIEKPLIESPTKHDFHHPSETKANEDSHIMPPENDGPCSQSSLLSDSLLDDSKNNIVCSPSSSPVMEAMVVDDVACKSPQNPSDSIVAIEKPQNEPPIFEDKVNHVEISNDQPISKFSDDKSASPVISDTHKSEVSLSMSTNGDVQPKSESELNNQGSN